MFGCGDDDAHADFGAPVRDARDGKSAAMLKFADRVNCGLIVNTGFVDVATVGAVVVDQLVLDLGDAQSVIAEPLTDPVALRVSHFAASAANHVAICVLASALG